MANSETIVAPVTPRGQGGVAVIRLSGPAAKAILERVTPAAERAFLEPRKLVFGAIHAGDWPETEAVDEGLVVFFPGPASYTGEDVVEVHLHGSGYLTAKMLSTFVALGARHARPGEFTERAYRSGKIDLSQAEAVADLIAAETEAQARVAREQLGGRLSEAVSDLGDPLRDVLAEIEAHIDFPDEDINPLTAAEWAEAIAQLEEVIAGFVSTYRTGRICREGALVVLAGAPNAGKSSLLNKLLGEERAIVTPIPGTTRDSIEEAASLDGLCVRFCDTAGLLAKSESRTPDPVEALGIERSWKKLNEADLCLFVYDASNSAAPEGPMLEKVKAACGDVLVVANKIDLVASDKAAPGSARVSAQTGAGIDELRRQIVDKIGGANWRSGSLLVTNERHFSALKQAQAALKDASEELKKKAPAELISLQIRSALGALEDIIGVTHTEDILGRIFSKFCIGK